MSKTKTQPKPKPPTKTPRRRARDKRAVKAPAAPPVVAVPATRTARPARSGKALSRRQEARAAAGAASAAADELRLPAPVWTSRRVRLGDLAPWQRNPRRIGAAAAARLRDSFEHYGQVELLAVGPDLQLYNGHQRLKVLSEQYGPDHELEVRQSSRALTEREREKLTIYLHRGAAGEFDLELLLKDWNLDDLDSWGFPDLNTPADALDEWQDMPEFDGKPRQHHELIVFFASAEHLAAFAELVQQQVTAETVSIWYPPREVVNEGDAQWVSDATEAEA